MGMTRDLFKKTVDTKKKFHKKLKSPDDRMRGSGRGQGSECRGSFEGERRGREVRRRSEGALTAGPRAPAGPSALG